MFKLISITLGHGGHLFVIDAHKSNFYKNPTAKIGIALSTTSDVCLMTFLLECLGYDCNFYLLT